jgi:cobalt-zinc-cadmium efflux system protein
VFIATAIAGAVVIATGFARADAVASLVVVVLMVRAGSGLVRQSGRIFLEAAPAGTDPDAIGDRLPAADAVAEVHDLHVQTITSGQPALSAHVLVALGCDCHGVRRALQRMLREDYQITHATLQVDHLGEDQDAGLIQVTSREATSTGLAPAARTPTGPVHHPGPHQR